MAHHPDFPTKQDVAREGLEAYAPFAKMLQFLLEPLILAHSASSSSAEPPGERAVALPCNRRRPRPKPCIIISAPSGCTSTCPTSNHAVDGPFQAPSLALPSFALQFLLKLPIRVLSAASSSDAELPGRQCNLRSLQKSFLVGPSSALDCARVQLSLSANVQLPARQQREGLLANALHLEGSRLPEMQLAEMCEV
jgi:hypothetical protein